MRTINKALFLDLDGTIITTKSGKTFAQDKEDWKFNQNIVERINKYVDEGFHILIVSNQGGIESGKVKLNDFRLKIRRIINDIIIHTGCPISKIGYRFCVSNNPEDYFRKPNPGMAYDLALAYILDLSQCLMVGDASGKVRNQEQVYHDPSSPTEWSFANGTHLNEAQSENVRKVDGRFGMLFIKDFSDSDLKFSKSAGMQYLDVYEFLNQR